MLVEDHGYETPCHVWQGALNSKGYALRGPELLHRLVYAKHVGPIPAGCQVHHLCHVRACVNAGHLAPLTAADHTRLHVDGALAPRLLALLADGRERTPRELAPLVGKPSGHVSVTLRRCAKLGEIERVARGVYRLPAEWKVAA